MDYGQYGKKRIFGVEIGEVVELEKGGARVKVLFQAFGNNCVSNWAPVVVPFAGPDMGTYFIPRIHDKVLVMFHQGDVNSPFVVRSIWTEEKRPPETGENQESDCNRDAKNNMRYIKSASGHLLIMDDAEDKEKIQIIDKTVNNRIEINNNKEAKENQTNFITSDGNINIKAPKGRVAIECKEFYVGTSTSINIQSEGTLELKSTKEMAVNSNEDLKVKGKRIEDKADVNMLSQGGANVEFKGGQIQLDSGGGLKRIAGRIHEVKGTQVQIGMGGAPMAPMAITATPTQAFSSVLAQESSSDTTMKKPSAGVKNEKRNWVEIELVDEDGEPVANEWYEVTLPNGSKKKGKLDRNGYARVEGIDSGTCKITFPELDKDSWKENKTI